jgi:hypothetical protein
MTLQAPLPEGLFFFPKEKKHIKPAGIKNNSPGIIQKEKVQTLHATSPQPHHPKPTPLKNGIFKHLFLEIFILQTIDI